MKKSTFKILLFLFLITTQAAFAKSGNFTVIDCNDGDTCRVKGETNKSFKVRLQGIDAPESAQEYGPQAKKVLNDLIKGKKVRLECDGQSFGRDNCTIYLNDKNINEEVVRLGMAIDLPRYSKSKYAHAEKEARDKKIGIWVKGLEKSPYCFRGKRGSQKKCKADPLTRW